MTRVQQLIKKQRIKKIKKKVSIKLLKNPQKKVICSRVLTVKPKKPNSANRRIIKAIIWKWNINLTAKIPGENHNLQQHSNILLEGGKIRDLIGVRYITIRGKFDLAGVTNRKTSRSRFGVKKI